MKKQAQAQQAQIQQTQATQQQAHQNQTKGGEAMKQELHQAQQETQIYFITFPTRVDNQKAREIVGELRKRFPHQMPIFAPRPPRGKKLIYEINGTIVILTFPHTKNPNKPQAPSQEAPKPNMQEQAQEGFTLKELIKNIKI